MSTCRERAFLAAVARGAYAQISLPPCPMHPRRIEVDSYSAAEFEAAVVRATRLGAEPLEALIRDLKRALQAQAGVYDTRALADLLGVAPQTVRKWRRQFGLPCRRVGGENGTALFLLSEVTEWVERMPADVRPGTM